TNFGFADASEVFVVLAGCAGFFAYSRPFQRNDWRAGLKKIGVRIGDLYLAHLAVLVVVAICLGAAAWVVENPGYLEDVKLTPLQFDPRGASQTTMKKQSGPSVALARVALSRCQEWNRAEPQQEAHCSAGESGRARLRPA